jgi:hypothetical protein
MVNDSSYPLTPEQRVSFERDGYLAISDALSPEQVDDVKAWVAEIKGWPNRPGEHMPYEEVRADGTRGLCRTESRSLHFVLNPLAVP